MMRKMIYLTALMLLCGIFGLQAEVRVSVPAADSLTSPKADTLSLSEMIHPTEEVAKPANEKPSRFLPMRRRIDREVDKNKFVYKGEVMMGLSASYATLSSEDSDFLLVLEHINADGSVTTIKPYVGYAYKDNHAVGVRFGYTHLRGDISNLGFNLGEQNDLTGALEDMAFDSDNFSFAIFHRSYVGIDAKGRFGVFAELEAAVHSGTSRFSYLSGDEIKYSNSDNIKFKLSFNPGVAVYIFPNVCGTLSFGLGGLQYAKVTQRDDAGQKVGSREASKLRFRLNLADINIGVTVHLWDKKKQKR